MLSTQSDVGRRVDRPCFTEDELSVEAREAAAASRAALAAAACETTRMRVFAIVLAVSAIIVTGCGSDDSISQATLPQTPSATTAPNATAAPTEAPEETAIGAKTPTEDAPAEEPVSAETPDTLYPDVLEVRANQAGDGSWAFDVTLSSPYDSPTRYADGWRILSLDGTELGLRLLVHDHAGEQPFTRSLSNVDIPDDVNVVIVEGRDQVSGWGGATVEVTLER